MKIVYAVADGINFKPEDPNWDISQIAFDCMTKSIYPDILFVTKEECLKKTVIYPMGCRAFLSKYEQDGKELYAGRFNFGRKSLNFSCHF